MPTKTPTITSEDVKDKLVEVDVVREILAATEPLTEIPFETNAPASVFTLPPGWNEGLKEADGNAVTAATVKLGGKEWKLTKDAALEATSHIQLTKDYVCKTPGPLVEMHLNYWMSHGTKSLKLLARPDTSTGLAFAKATISPFSNVRLMDEALDAIEEKYGKGEVYVDRKFSHDLRRTSLRLVIPESTRQINSLRNGGVEDNWSMGINLRNSLIGEIPLAFNGYTFAWWCTNGAISTHSSSGNYNRKNQGQSDSVYEWARTSFEEILNSQEGELDFVEELTEINLEGELADTMADLFAKYGVPMNSRESIMASLIDSDDLTAYGLVNAVTAAANTEGIHDKQVTQLMSVGGDLVHAMSTRCNSCHRFGAV